MSEKFRIPAQLLISYWDKNIQISIFQKYFVARRTFEGRWLPAGVGRGLLERDGGEQGRGVGGRWERGMAWNGGENPPCPPRMDFFIDYYFDLKLDQSFEGMQNLLAFTVTCS